MIGDYSKFFTMLSTRMWKVKKEKFCELVYQIKLNIMILLTIMSLVLYPMSQSLIISNLLLYLNYYSLVFDEVSTSSKNINSSFWSVSGNIQSPFMWLLYSQKLFLLCSLMQWGYWRISVSESIRI